MPAPHAAQTAGGDLHAIQHQLLGDPERAMAGVIQAIGEAHLLDLLGYPIGMRPPGCRQAVDEALGAVEPAPRKRGSES